jgi:uncharacterized protein
MPVHNKTRGTLIAHHLLTLNSNFPNTLTFINRHGVPSECALWITPCSAIYTVGMKNAVDIAFLDREGCVVKMFRSFPPDCFADSPPLAVSAVELPPKTLLRSRTCIGDLLKLDPA